MGVLAVRVLADISVGFQRQLEVIEVADLSTITPTPSQLLQPPVKTRKPGRGRRIEFVWTVQDPERVWLPTLTATTRNDTTKASFL